jgi:hypothetical protein
MLKLMGDTPNTVPWYQSAVVRRLAYSIAVQALGATHLSHYITSGALEIIVDDLLEAAGMVYAAWAIHARATKPMPALAMTQTRADVANIMPTPPPVPTPPHRGLL